MQFAVHTRRATETVSTECLSLRWGPGSSPGWVKKLSIFVRIVNSTGTLPRLSWPQPSQACLHYSSHPSCESFSARDGRQPPPKALEEGHEQGWPHGRKHRRARSASLPTRSATLETSPSATHFTYGLSTMRSASDILAKAAIADLTDWNQWHRHARCVMLRPWFRGGCHACFCRPDGWIPNVLVVCQHEVSPWLLRRTARSAPPSFYPASRKPPPAAAQMFVLVSHFMADCQHL